MAEEEELDEEAAEAAAKAKKKKMIIGIVVGGALLYNFVLKGSPPPPEEETVAGAPAPAPVVEPEVEEGEIAPLEELVVNLADPDELHYLRVGVGAVLSAEAVLADIETQLPKVVARTGYADDFHMAGQWFPKLGVLEEEAGWQAHTFTTWSEFYADFGNYDVRLDVPAEMVVGATGIRTGEVTEGERKRLTYHAEMVHDFAWTADPDFVEHWGEYDGIRIRQLMMKEALPEAEAHMDAQLWTLESMEARFGAYPWSTITIVHPPPEGSGAYGMEYPTLYTTSPRERLPGGFIEERMSGIFTTTFGCQVAMSRASFSMPSSSVAMTSALIGPSTISQISMTTSR